MEVAQGEGECGLGNEKTKDGEIFD